MYLEVHMQYKLVKSVLCSINCLESIFYLIFLLIKIIFKLIYPLQITNLIQFKCIQHNKNTCVKLNSPKSHLS